MTMYLNNTYGFIGHGIRAILYAWLEELLPGTIVLDAMITYYANTTIYDRNIGTGEAFVHETPN